MAVLLRGMIKSTLVYCLNYTAEAVLLGTSTVICPYCWKPQSINQSITRSPNWYYFKVLILSHDDGFKSLLYVPSTCLRECELLKSLLSR